MRNFVALEELLFFYVRNVATDQQLEELLSLVIKNIYKRSNSSLSDSEINEISKKVLSNIRRYTFEQFNQIILGLKNGVRVDFYCDPVYDYQQMKQIRLGLQNDIDVSVYLDPSYSWDQMEKIRIGMEKKLNYSIYAKHEFTAEQMEEILLGLEEQVDVSVYANPTLTPKQMHHIRELLKTGLNIQDITLKKQ